MSTATFASGALLHPTVVVDASVWASWIMPQDANHIPTQSWMSQYISGGGLLVAPSLLLIEVTAAVRRQSGDPNYAKRIMGYLSQVPELRVVPLDSVLVQASGVIAADWSLRASDAVYTALATQLQLPLVSWDQQQLQRSSAVIPTYMPDGFPF